MTNEEAQLAKARKLDRPKLREKMIWFIQEGQYQLEYRQIHLVDFFLSLLPDEEEIRKQERERIIEEVGEWLFQRKCSNDAVDVYIEFNREFKLGKLEVKE